MRVLLDECIDWRFGRHIRGHDVRTARQMGWTAIQNGHLLSLASRSFDIFVTVDRNISFQQNLDAFPIAIVVLRAKSNRLAHLEPLIPNLLLAIEAATPSGFQIVSA